MSGTPVIPQQDHQCIWVDAGVVGYKLCDKNFECDKCRFHRFVSRQQAGAAAEMQVPEEEAVVVPAAEPPSPQVVIDRLIERLEAAEFPDDRLYGPGHTWVRETAGGEWHIGVDHIGAGLLEEVTDAVEMQAPQHLERNAPFTWMVLRDGAVAVRTPASGTLKAFNPEFNRRPAIVRNDPYHEGWIAELTVSDLRLLKKETMTAAQMKQKTEQHLRRLREDLTAALHRTHGSVGPTLLDGGMPVDSVQALLGGKTYVQLVNSFLAGLP